MLPDLSFSFYSVFLLNGGYHLPTLDCLATLCMGYYSAVTCTVRCCEPRVGRGILLYTLHGLYHRERG